MILFVVLNILSLSNVHGFLLSLTGPQAPKVFDPTCLDKIDTCWNMPQSNCLAPYEAWAQDNCANRCGYCNGPTTPAPPCVNKLPNCESYDKSTCSNPDYQSWAGENCRYYCRLCPQSELNRLDAITTTIKPEDCVDKVDCRQYGANACSGQFKAWSQDNCPNYCGFCTGIPTPPPTCEDKIPNCKAYNPDTCTNADYKLWVEDNCKKYCGLCAGSSGPATLAPPMPGSGSSIPATAAPLIPGRDIPIITYQPPTPPTPLPGKRSENDRSKRQFHASHHHGGTPDCWDGNTNPSCIPNNVDSTDGTNDLSGSSFPGSEFQPNPTSAPDWDKKPTTEKAKPTVITESSSTALPLSSQTPSTETPAATPSTTPMPTTSAPTDIPLITTTTDSPVIVTDPVTTTTVFIVTDTDQPLTTTTDPPPTSDIAQPETTTIPVPPNTGAPTTATVPLVTGAPTTDAATPTTQVPTTEAATPSTAAPTAATVPLFTKAPTTDAAPPTNQTPTTVTVPPTTQAPTTVTALPTTQAPTNATEPLSTVAQGECVDLLENCISYGRNICVDPTYKPWAEKRCKVFCGFCTPVTSTPFPCVDRVGNCNEYGSELCTSPTYYEWSYKNCIAFCGYPPCGTGPPTRNTEPTPSNAVSELIPTVSTKPTKETGNGSCKDQNNSCFDLSDAKCFGIYESWARAHCPLRCGFCGDLPVCEDKQDCSIFGQEVCSNPEFEGWSRENCRKFCNRCGRPTPPAETTTQSSV